MIIKYGPHNSQRNWYPEMWIDFFIYQERSHSTDMYCTGVLYCIILFFPIPSGLFVRLNRTNSIFVPPPKWNCQFWQFLTEHPNTWSHCWTANYAWWDFVKISSFSLDENNSISLNLCNYEYLSVFLWLNKMHNYDFQESLHHTLYQYCWHMWFSCLNRSIFHSIRSWRDIQFVLSKIRFIFEK